MAEFNYTQWMQDNKVGPYGKRSKLAEAMEAAQTYGVFAKTPNYLLAYVDPKGSYTKEQLDAWYTKGQEAGQNRNISFFDSKEEAMQADQEPMEEDTYDQTYNDGGSEDPQPEDEQFQESMYDIHMDQGQTNTAISHYSNAELNMDNDVMPDDYSVPNPGLGADTDAAWKPKPFDNAKTSVRTLPTKYGW